MAAAALRERPPHCSHSNIIIADTNISKVLATLFVFLEARWLEHRKRDRSSLEKIPEGSEPLTKFQAAARGALTRGQLATIEAQMLALLVISRGFRDKLRNP